MALTAAQSSCSQKVGWRAQPWAILPGWGLKLA